MIGRSANPFRRTALVALVAASATAAAVVMPGFAGAQEEFVNGSGRAKSQILRVGPSAAQLSLAPAAGVALADHLGVLGRGESLAFDYAALDGTVQDDVPPATDSASDESDVFPYRPIDPKGKQLPPIRAECTINRCDGYQRAENVPGVVQEAEAKAKPAGGQGQVIPDGFSAASLQAFEIPGVIKVSGGRATSFSGVFKEGSGSDEKTLRKAGGTVDIGQVELLGLGSPFVLTGLHWEAMQVTDENDDTTPQVTGKFVLGSALVNGETHDGPITGDQVKTLFDGINGGFDAMGPIDPGIRFGSPIMSGEAAVARLGALSIQIIDSDFGKTAVAPVTGGLQGPRGEITQGYFEQCFAAAGEEHEGKCGIPTLVGDLVVGVVSGAGRLDIDLGGVLATTEGQVFDGFNLFGGGGFSLPTGGLTGSTGSTTPGLGNTSVLGATTSNTGAVAPLSPSQAASPPQSGGTEVAAPQEYRLTGSRASAAWAVGLVGLGAALAMAASDYRRLRSRRRAVTPIT